MPTRHKAMQRLRDPGVHPRESQALEQHLYLPRQHQAHH